MKVDRPPRIAEEFVSPQGTYTKATQHRRVHESHSMPRTSTSNGRRCALVVGAPNAPTTVTAAPGAGLASVHWTAPATNNGAAITSYVITPFVGGVAQLPRTFVSTATTQTITGLASGTSFVFRVAATNSRGTGPSSAPSNLHRHLT